MAVLGAANMHHNACQFILIVLLFVEQIGAQFLLLQLVALGLFLPTGKMNKLLRFFLLPPLEALSGEGLEVEVLGELEPGVDFLVLEGVEVENDPLEVDDEDVREVGEAVSLGDFVFGLAVVAVVVLDDLALDELAEGVVVVFEVFDLEGHVVEVLVLVPHVLAAVAEHLRADFPAVNALQNVLERRLFQPVFELVENHVQELLGVLLDAHVHGLAREVLEGEAEVRRVVRLPFGLAQEGEHVLELVEHVVVHHFAVFFALLQILLLLVVCHQNCVSFF
jgi:hypothetical protein